MQTRPIGARRDLESLFFFDFLHLFLVCVLADLQEGIIRNLLVLIVAIICHEKHSRKLAY